MNCETWTWLFFRRVKKRLQGDDPQQLKRELQWLQTQVGRYKGKIFAVGLLSLTGTIMVLFPDVASKYLIDAVTGYGADMLWRAVASWPSCCWEALFCKAFPPGWAPASTWT